MQTSDQTQAATCAYPKCTDPKAIAVGAVCYNTTTDTDIFNNGEWVVCPSEPGSGAASCQEQQDACVVRSKFVSTTTFELATSDEASGAFLGQVATVVGGLFGVMTSVYSSAAFIVIGGIVMPVILAFVYMLILFLFAKIII